MNGMDGAEEAREGFSLSPWHRLIKGDCHLNCDCQSCLQGPQWIDCFFQSITNGTITGTYPFNAYRSQLAHRNDATSRGTLSKSRGGHVDGGHRHCTYAHAGVVDAAYVDVACGVDAALADDSACDCAVVTHTYACVDARELPPPAASQRSDGGHPGGPPPSISPKAPTSEISKNPSLSPRSVK